MEVGMSGQPKPDVKGYDELIHEIEGGIVKVPKFQRDLVWDISQTAKLLDSILKGYPIGTFILWKTSQRLNDVKEIGGIDLPEPPDGKDILYVLDGQQRITSLFAAYKGVEIPRKGKKKPTDYKDIVIDLSNAVDEESDQVVVERSDAERCVSLHDVLHFDFETSERLKEEGFSTEELKRIDRYSKAFSTYSFSTVALRKNDIDSAIDVFTRINTGGKVLTLFEIMSAKTYDEKSEFDMQAEMEKFQDDWRPHEFADISPMVVLQLLSLLLSENRECKRKTILTLDRDQVVENWERAIESVNAAIRYIRAEMNIPASQLLPYDTLLVPFAYFFATVGKGPNPTQAGYLEELFFRSALSQRYSSSTESRLAADIKRVERIVTNERPTYSDFALAIKSIEDVTKLTFSTSNAVCKAILCIFAQKRPKEFGSNQSVNLQNVFLKSAKGKNFARVFPLSVFESREEKRDAGSVANTILVESTFDKRKIRSKSPSQYFADFDFNERELSDFLVSHLIDPRNSGVLQDNFSRFLQSRSSGIFSEITKRIEPEIDDVDSTDDLSNLIDGGETGTVEFKETLRFDINSQQTNKNLEFAVVKVLASFLNTSGGHLIIGVSDGGNVIGLDRDINTLEGRNLDAFLRHFSAILKKFLGVNYGRFLTIDFPKINGMIVCRVVVSKGDQPTFLGDDFFVRIESTSSPLGGKEQHEWIQGHFSGQKD